MTDAEFLQLNPRAAGQYLQTLPEIERARLARVWNEKRGYTFANDGADVDIEPVRHSNMLAAGRLAFIGGFIAALVSGLAAANGSAYDDTSFPRLAALFFASIATIGFFLWIAGAIEERLIEIRDRLPKREAERASA